MKRIITILLTTLISLTSCPINIYAIENEKEIVEEETNNEKIIEEVLDKETFEVEKNNEVETLVEEESKEAEEIVEEEKEEINEDLQKETKTEELLDTINLLEENPSEEITFEFVSNYEGITFDSITVNKNETFNFPDHEDIYIEDGELRNILFSVNGTSIKDVIYGDVVYSLKGWDVIPTSLAPVYKPNEEAKAKISYTFYAVWDKEIVWDETYTLPVTFDGIPEDQFLIGYDITSSAKITFYKPGEVIDINEHPLLGILYAVFEKDDTVLINNRGNNPTVEIIDNKFIFPNLEDVSDIKTQNQLAFMIGLSEVKVDAVVYNNTYELKGWDSSIIANEAKYLPGEEGNLNEHGKYYTVWQLKESILNDEIVMPSEEDCANFIPEGYYLASWSVPLLDVAFVPGLTYHASDFPILNNNIILVGNLKEKAPATYTVTLDYRGYLEEEETVFEVNNEFELPSTIGFGVGENTGKFIHFYDDQFNLYDQFDQEIILCKNYDLLGWSEDENATEPTYYPGEIVSINSDKKLYAVLKEAESTYFDVFLPYKDEFDIEGYELDGFYTFDENQNKIIIPEKFSFELANYPSLINGGNIICTFKNINTKVTIDNNGHGYEFEDIKAVIGETITLPYVDDTEYEKTLEKAIFTFADGVIDKPQTYNKYYHYKFLGFAKDKNETDPNNIYPCESEIVVEENMKLYCIWEYESKWDPFYTPMCSKNGYVVSGWWSDINKSEVYFDMRPEPYDLAEYYDVTPQRLGYIETLYASWRPATYFIEYELNGGEVDVKNPEEYNVETPTFKLNNPTKPGYDFVGWTGTGLLIPIKNVYVLKGTHIDLEYEANYKIINYSVNYVNAESSTGKRLEPSSYNVEMSDEERTLPTVDDLGVRNGFKFLGWYDNPDYNGEPYEVIPTDIYDNVTYYAKWQAIEQSLNVITDAIIVDNSAGILSASIDTPSVEQVKTMLKDTSLYDGYVNEGKPVEIWLEIRKAESVSEIKKHIPVSISNAIFFDLDLKACFVDEHSGTIKITEPGSKIKVTMTLDPNKASLVYGTNNNYYLMREHGSSYNLLNASVDKINQINAKPVYLLTFESDKYSTFGLYSLKKSTPIIDFGGSSKKYNTYVIPNTKA